MTEDTQEVEASVAPVPAIDIPHLPQVQLPGSGLLELTLALSVICKWLFGANKDGDGNINININKDED